ncbi:hypothetical protein M409DRAFT_29530 [Zasmidium cellare ATCC 36951]|uniref:Uncharacterized protein n=1 Tax=Zasmidium cellare ATCC 36951 TaxID=1080233 RepID=A0A6A6BYQ7_ZASCE|nr:uncharacterized protein M409DRAFT_29530 [Zasmidium cellare ATCC 36951]KAF2159921.1 hypothetical protein M409DRAFT_29530 [Zasmidium cellare ATCC 36951]
MPEPLHLTFGIELEFMCVFRRGAFNNQEPDLLPTSEELNGNISAGHALQYFLHAANVPATGWEELGTVPLNAVPYSRWCVKEDCIQLSPQELNTLPEGYFEEAIEISSRILSFIGDDWRGEIRTVLNVLAMMQRRFDAHFLSNDSTGFHVHIGNAGGAPMPFDTVKRIFQLTTAHERVIDSMHASSRVLAPAHKEDDTFPLLLYGPVSYFHIRDDEEFDLDNNNLFGWLERIEDMHTFEDFCEMFTGDLDSNALSGHSSAVNFDNLWSETYEDTTNTVEFRQHVGTIDYAEIIAWVTFLANLTNFCHNTTDVNFMNLMLQATDMDFTAIDLMRIINCPDDIIQHYDYEGEGEGAIIGMLPQPGIDTTMTDTLLALAAQNDDEVSDNTDRLRVKRLINDKLACEHYGFDSALGRLPINQPLLEQMLMRAYRKVSQCMFTICDLRLPGGKSQAKSVVFKLWAEMLRDYDPTLGPSQPAIVDPLRKLW